MNREDAKVVLAFMEDKTKNEDEQDALLMAIDALSVDGDTISRADAIEAIFKVGHEHVEEKVIPLGAVTDYSDAIKALPSADAVQGVGRYEKAMQKLREMPRYLNGVKAKQINKIPPETIQRR